MYGTYLCLFFTVCIWETSKFPPSNLKLYTKLTGPCAYTLHNNPQMVQMAFCDLPHTFHKHVTNVSQHVFVILLWRILKSPLSSPYLPLVTHLLTPILLLTSRYPRPITQRSAHHLLIPFIVIRLATPDPIPQQKTLPLLSSHLFTLRLPSAWLATS